VATYRHLIARMPRGNQYLLLYVLDLLSVFARKSDKNLMTAANLAVIFRPGLISHPNHELSPGEHQLSQSVLEFLIDQQDSFLLDIPPPPRPDPSSSWRPPARPNSRSPHDPDDPDLVLLTSDDERPSADGWKRVGKDSRRITRRRTTHEPLADADERSETPKGVRPVSPAPEWPARSSSAMSGSLHRSRTLPSQRSGSDDDRRRSRLLRKQRPHTPLPERLSPGVNMSA